MVKMVTDQINAIWDSSSYLRVQTEADKTILECFSTDLINKASDVTDMIAYNMLGHIPIIVYNDITLHN